MKLDNGLYQDCTPEEQPEGTYRWALNWLNTETLGALTTEYSSILLNLNIVGTIVGVIPTPNQLILFSVTDAGNCEIGVYSEKSNSYTALLNNTIVDVTLHGPSVTSLGFTVNHEIKGTYRYNSFSEIEIVFTDTNSPPKMMYLPDVDKTGANLDIIVKYYDNYSINKLNLFQEVSNTDITYTVGTGGSLPVDTYLPFYRYKNQDGSGSGYYVIGEPAFISTAGLDKNQYNTKTNSIIGANTNKAIKINFTVIDTSFALMEVGVLKVSTNEALVLASLVNSVGDYTIVSLDKGITLSGGLSNLLANIYNYNKVQTLTSLNQQLLLGGLSSTTVTLPQKWANTVKLNWHCKWLDFNSSDIDLKNPNTPYKTFQAGETYSFFIRGVKNERASEWCHIAGRKTKTNLTIGRNVDRDGSLFTYKVEVETQSINDIPFITANSGIFNKTQYLMNNSITIANQAPFYSLFDSIDFTTITDENRWSDENTGEFCYWENNNEPYSTYFEGNDLAIGNTGSVLNNTGNINVRHHKFPSYATLQKLRNKYTYDDVSDLTRFDFTTQPATVNKYTDCYSRTFCSVVPQLGVNIDLSGIDAGIKAQFDYFEIGYTQRSSANSTVIATDISLFGQYRAGNEGFQEVGDEPYKLYAASAALNQDARLFTGGNFNNLTGAAVKQWTLNGSWVKKVGDVYTERLPNRVHIHTPDLVDQVDFNNDSLGTLTQYIENEVLMSVSNPYNDGNWDLLSAGERIYMMGGRDSEAAETLIFNTLVPDSGDWIRWINVNYNYLFDYTVNNNKADVHGVDTSLGDKSKYNQKGVANQTYSARSDNWYPDAYKKQKVKETSYIPANIGTTTLNGIEVEQGVPSVVGITGSTNHLHFVLEEDNILSPLNFSNRFNITQDSQWASKSMIGDSQSLDWYNQYTFSRFMRKCMTSFDLETVGNVEDIAGSYLSGDMQHNTFLTTLRKHTTNIYVAFDTLEVLKTETKINPLSSTSVFYGDMFISDVNYVVRGNSTTVARTRTDGAPNPTSYAYPTYNTCVYRFLAPTRKNLNLRYTEGDTVTQSNKFYPLGAMTFENGVPSLYTQPAGGITAGYNIVTKPQSLLLEPEFNKQNDVFFNSEVYKKNKTFLSTFPFRILQSLTQQQESSINNWRSFPAGNYYEIDKTKGYIVNLQYFDDIVLIHTNQTLLQTKGVGKLDAGGTSINIGVGNIFDFPPQDVQYDNLGYVGTQHQHSCKLTPFGYIFADTLRGKIFAYRKGEKPLELSSAGMFKYFRDYLRTVNDDFGNSLSGIHTYFDYKYQRVVITCKGDTETEPFTEPFTISFDGKKWISFHSYVPDIATNTSSQSYSIFKNKVFKHNDTNSTLSFGEKVDDVVTLTSFDAQIDYTANGTTTSDKTGRSFYGMKDNLKLFQAFNWRTQCYDLANNKIIHNDTFYSARVYNEHQLSEKVILNSDLTTNNYNVRQYSGTFRFNSFRDSLLRADDYSIPEFISNPNKGYLLDVDNTLINSSIFVRKFTERYSILRLTAEASSKALKLIDIDSTFKVINK
jgi:hypothetical protein